MTQSLGARAQIIAENDTLFTGIDFVHIADPETQNELHVYFITDATNLGVPFSGTGALSVEDIEIIRVGDESAKPLKVTGIDYVDPGPNEGQIQIDPVSQRSYMVVWVEEPGDFGKYRITLKDPLEADQPDGTPTSPFSRIDPVYNGIVFDFKAGCPSTADCETAPLPCPPEVEVDFPVDYMARDFTSFRGALLDFAAQRYPQWSFPTDADVGVVMAEMFSALGDEFAYMQDRFAREAFLETATERRSLRRMARLVDFEIHDGRSPITLLTLEIDDAQATGLVSIDQGTRVWSRTSGGSALAFELGLGLHDTDSNYQVSEAWNTGALVPYLFDESDACLDVGATEIILAGDLGGEEGQDFLNNVFPRRKMYLETHPEDPSIPVRRLFVEIESVEALKDPLNQSVELTRIRWKEGLPYQIDQNLLSLNLNVLPFTAGETVTEEFVTRSDSEDPELRHAVVREGALVPRVGNEDGSSSQGVREAEACGGTSLELSRAPIVLYGLTGTASRGLGYFGASLRNSVPEIRLTSTSDNVEWGFVPQMLTAGAGEEVFTVDDGVWTRVRRFRNGEDEYIHQDYANGSGYSIRFGDGQFGRVPDVGETFQVTYRTGPGATGNLPAGALTAVSEIEGEEDPVAPMPGFVLSFRNPLPITTGVDPESDEDIRLLAPEVYRHNRRFALQPRDYGERAEDLDFVDRAAGAARWTGSWLSTFVTIDPKGATQLSEQQLEKAEGWMDCVRQTGRDVIVQQPDYVPLDLRINVCVEDHAYASHVMTQVRAVLMGVNGEPGFFHPDNFTFGTPLHRAALEAAIQSVPGVRSVRRMRVRLRGVQPMDDFKSLSLTVTPKQVLRLDDDQQNPENGTLVLIAEGGA